MLRGSVLKRGSFGADPFSSSPQGRYAHPAEDYAVTHIEAAKLHAYPDFVCGSSPKMAIVKQIGNAVPTALVSAVAAHLVQHL
ncbi:DNA cytosine methyltransferase [Arthrobacter sp. NPDC056886]|uniref:DNA cytosine methyltransferase n=1 Tax=Arthrobacter sp. NPDC056886 TaxID=3345960 RepID=UPI00366E1520